MSLQGEFWRITDSSQMPLLLSHLKQQPLPFRLQIVPDGRSLDQNDCFRGMCRDIAEFWNAHHGEKTTAEAVARDLKVAYGKIVTEYTPVTGKRTARIESTTRYTKAEMSALIDATLAWAGDNGIPLPDPRAA